MYLDTGSVIFQVQVKSVIGPVWMYSKLYLLKVDLRESFVGSYCQDVSNFTDGMKLPAILACTSNFLTFPVNTRSCWESKFSIPFFICPVTVRW